MSYYQDKVVWITGASSGLGEAFAKEFAAQKAKLVLSARRIDELNRVKAECSRMIPEENILILPLDICNLSKTEPETEAIVRKFGRLDILMNNAGVSQRSFIADTPLEVERKIMEINFFGTLAITKLALAIMRRQNSGHILVMSSIMGKFGFYRRSTYAASKHALHGYFETLRMEEAAHNIFVTMICPGFVHTSISLNAITETGQGFNKMDVDQAKGMEPAEVAKQALRGVRRKRVEVLIGGSEMAAPLVKRLFPRLFFYLIMREKRNRS